MPLAFEARADESQVPALARADGADVESAIVQLLKRGDVSWLQIRHAEAGCFIARAERS